jgi:predicted DsbA family dithiol-disulfide isomerase
LGVVKVEIWSDVVCPWCYVGKGRFEEALRRLGWDESDVEVTFRPFELDPNVPPGGLEIGDYLRRKFGSAATVEAIEGRVGEAGAELGLTFDWPKVRRVNTFDAHRLLEWALVTAGPAAQGRLKRRLMQAYFAEGGDVSDHPALAALAAEVGLDGTAAAEVLASGAYGAEVRAAEGEARDLEIHAVPTFVVERRFAIPGAQDPETFVQVLARMRNRLAEEAAADDALDEAAACTVDQPDC